MWKWITLNPLFLYLEKGNSALFNALDDIKLSVFLVTGFEYYLLHFIIFQMAHISWNPIFIIRGGYQREFLHFCISVKKKLQERIKKSGDAAPYLGSTKTNFTKVYMTKLPVLVQRIPPPPAPESLILRINCLFDEGDPCTVLEERQFHFTIISFKMTGTVGINTTIEVFLITDIQKNRSYKILVTEKNIMWLYIDFRNNLEICCGCLQQPCFNIPFLFFVFHPLKSEINLCQNHFPLSPFRENPPQAISDKIHEGRSVSDLKGWGND